MKNKVLFRALAFAVAYVMTFALAGCGSSNKEANSEKSAVVQTSTAGQTSTADQTTQEPAKKVKITLWGKPNSDAGENEKKSYDYQISKYKEKYPNVEIEEVSVKPGIDYREQYDKALMSGEEPTLTRSFSYTDIPTRIKDGTIADITELVNNWDLKKQNLVIKTFDEAISSNGKWYAIPYASGVVGMAYNKTAIQAGGGDVNNLPKTWDEFAAMGKKVTDKSVPRFGYILVGMDWNVWPFTPWVWSAGGEMVRPNSDGTFKIAFNEDPGVDAALFWNEMIWKYEMTQKDVLEDWDAVIQDAVAGRGAFAFGDPTWYSGDAVKKYNIPKDSFGFMGIPVKDASIPSPCLAGGEVWTFSPKADKDQLEAAWNFAQLVTYDEDFLIGYWAFMSPLHGVDMRNSARVDLTEKKYSYITDVPQWILKEFSEVSKNAKPEPYCSNWNDLKNTLAKPLQSILLKKNITRDEVKKILDGAADELYQKYPDSFKK
ncbi:MAG: hypothetical protein ABFD25_02720 [Clostridiaceae bacterium]